MSSHRQQISVQLDFPIEILGALDVTRSQLAARLRELIVLEMYRERQISSGKGAELLGMSKWEFIQFAARHDVPYFDESAEELTAEVEVVQQTGRGRSA